MSPDPTVGGSLAWALWFLGQVAFQWVPGAVVSVVGTAPASGVPAPAPTAITDPITAPQVVQYFQMASTPEAYNNLFREWSTFVALSLLISLSFAALIIYCSIRMFQLRRVERRRFAALQNTVAAHDVPKTQLRWRHVLEEAGTGNERSWRLAILEADIMLNELLDTLGLRGETMADKMKKADPATFQTIDLAWEAHRFRNVIVHEGSTQVLNAREVRRIIGLYEKIFREFKFID